jgi:hypothetical protein
MIGSLPFTPEYEQTGDEAQMKAHNANNRNDGSEEEELVLIQYRVELSGRGS